MLQCCVLTYAMESTLIGDQSDRINSFWGLLCVGECNNIRLNQIPIVVIHYANSIVFTHLTDKKQPPI